MEKISEIMDILQEKYPTTKTTLNNMRGKKDLTPFQILISCLISLQTRDENTKKATESLYKIARTPKEISELPDEKLEQLIFSSGHYKKKTQTLKHVSKTILNEFQNKVPSTYEELITIKGIGPKTANIVLAFAFNQEVIPIDTNAHRISNRLAFVKTTKSEETSSEIKKVLPKKYWSEYNSICMQHGREICLPLNPRCSLCPIKEFCPKIGVKKSR